MRFWVIRYRGIIRRNRIDTSAARVIELESLVIGVTEKDGEGFGCVFAFYFRRVSSRREG